MLRINISNAKGSPVKINSDNVGQICRLCLERNGTTNIFQTPINGGMSGKYVELISLLSLVQVNNNDGFPSTVCNICVDKLKDIQAFREKIKTRQVLLCLAMGKIILQPLKQSLNQISNETHHLNTDHIKLINSNQPSNLIFDDQQMAKHKEIPLKLENTAILHEGDISQDQDKNVNSQISTIVQSSEGSILYNILSEDQKESISNGSNDTQEKKIDKADANSIMEDWKLYHCCVVCNSNPKTHPECRFFKFPIDEERSKKWREIMKLDNLSHLSAQECHKQYLLCSEHFSERMLRGKNRKTLRKDALPTDFSEEKEKKTKSVAVQTESINYKLEGNGNSFKKENFGNEVCTYSDLICKVKIEDLDNETFPNELLDHSYIRTTKSIKTLKNTDLEAEKVDPVKPTKFNCISFNEDGTKIYTCCFCGAQFENREEYKKHKFKEYRKRKPEIKVRIPCTVCQKMITKAGMKDHLAVHNGEKNYVCEICGKSYHSSANLADHKASHKQKYQCEICGHNFRFLRLLKEHLNRHEGEPSYVCHICGYACYTKYTFRLHEKAHLEGKENFLQRQLKFPGRTRLVGVQKKCDVCKKECHSHAHLIIHMRSHTGEKPFKCSECGKNFTTRAHMQNHQMIHAGLKRFVCNICGKRFVLNGNLQQHILVHTGEKPHQCLLCSKRFYTRSALRKHLKTHKPKFENSD